MLKSFGAYGENGINEVKTTIAIIWLAACLYVAEGFLFRNPLFGFVYLHVLNALRCKT